MALSGPGRLLRDSTRLPSPSRRGAVDCVPETLSGSSRSPSPGTDGWRPQCPLTTIAEGRKFAPLWVSSRETYVAVMGPTATTYETPLSTEQRSLLRLYGWRSCTPPSG